MHYFCRLQCVVFAVTNSNLLWLFYMLHLCVRAFVKRVHIPPLYAPRYGSSIYVPPSMCQMDPHSQTQPFAAPANLINQDQLDQLKADILSKINGRFIANDSGSLKQKYE